MPPLALSSLLLLVTTMLVAVANRGTLAMPVELATKEAETPHKTRAQASVESGNQNIIGHLEERQSQQQQHKHYFSHNHNQHQRPMPQANSPYWPQVPVAMEDNSILPERTTLTADHRPITMTQPLTAPPQPHQNRQHDLNDHDLKPHQPNDYFRTTSLMHNSHLAHHRAGEPTNQQTGPPNSSFSAPLPSSSSANNNKTNDIPPPNTPSSNNHSHYNKQQQLQLQTHPEQTNPDNNNNNTTNQSTPFVFYDTPYNRRQLAKYILMEFHESDLNSVLENTPAILEAGRREVFGQVASEALIEAGSSASSGNLTGATLINGSSSPIGPGAVSNQHRPFYGEVFESFHTVYWPIHCVMCLVICTLGIPANLINVIVLTRQNMISAVNTILCAIACSDLIVNIAYIPYLIHELADSSNESAYYSYNWACYILIHAHATVTAHTISIWLTCALATWRYCVIRSQSSNKRNWSVELAKRAIAGVACFVPVFCIPNYLSFAIVHETTDKNTTIYKVGFSELSENSQFIKTSHFWIFSCLTKLLPCLLLTFFTTVLIKLMSEARKRRLRLTNNFTRNSSDNATMLHSKSSIPNGLKIGHHQRKASMDPRELDTQRRASEADPNGHHAHGVHGARGGKIAANGFRLRPGLLKRPRQDNRRTASKDDADGDDDRCGGSERVTSRSGRVAVGENNNLQLLARNMSMQRNVMVIKEAAGKCQPHQNDDDGDDGKGKKSRQTGGGHYHHQHRYQRQQTGHRFGELESSSGPFNNRLTSSMGSHEIIDFSTSANNELTDNATSGNNKSNNPASYVTPHSGSSCATDAECLHGSASSSSSDTSTDALDHQTVVQTNFQHYPHQQQQQQHPQQLLVETTAPKSMQAVSTTTRTLMMTSDDRANLIGDSSNNNNEEPPQRHPSSGMPPRSASTSGALELYAVNNNNGTGGAQSRLTMIAQNDRYAPTTTATGAPPTLGVVPRLSPGNGIRKSGMTSAHRSASASVQTNLLPENKHTSLMSTEAGDHTNSNDATRAAETATAADTIVTQDQTQTRPRSIGSASLAPLQIVRFQATHRQLSQNETTTRLLIAVIILFLVCEFPAGILAALCAILGQDFFDNVYQPMGTLTDLLALINSSVNFILYCFMSTQFRVTFYRVVLRCPSPRDVSSLK